MQLNLIAIGNKMPSWVNEGYQEYAKRLPKDFSLKLLEISAEKRGKNADTKRILEKESQKLWAAVSKPSYVIALDAKGKTHNTEQLAEQLEKLQQEHAIINFFIGGPEGFAPECLHEVNECWSLSALTLPHPLVRVLLAEQIYRSWSWLNRHPYHK